MVWKHPIFACVSQYHDETKSLPIFVDQIHAKTIISRKYPFLIMKTITLALRIIFQDYQHINHSPKCVFRQSRVPNIIPQMNTSLLVNALLISAIFSKNAPSNNVQSMSLKKATFFIFLTSYVTLCQNQV